MYFEIKIYALILTKIFFPIIMICIFLIAVRMISIIILMHVIIMEVIFPIMIQHDKISI